MSYDDNMSGLAKQSPTDRLESIAAALDTFGPSQATIDGAVHGIRQIVDELRDAANAEPADKSPAEGPSPPSIEEQIGIGWRAVLNGRDGRPMVVVGYTARLIGGNSLVFDTPDTSYHVVDDVTCVWHDEDGRPQQATYPFLALEVFPPRSGT